MVATSATFPLIAELLADQQRLDTPVARFTAAQHRSAHPSDEARTDAQLIPLSAPAPGEQYAFEVDLDACSGCKSCVTACHALNGLEEGETWRNVGLLVSADRRHAYAQTVTSACHHCADPACLNGCPVLAYEKDAVTGIVRHLDDQCIGCSYCVLTCPYEAPKYSARLGIVRKCDLCHGRLTHGEPPACVQACPTQAIRVTLVRTANYGRQANNLVEAGMGNPAVPTSPPEARAGEFLPSAADPSHTRPTTRYRSRRGIPAHAIAADNGVLRPEPAHWPLVVLLLLMPMAVGCEVLDQVVGTETPALALVAWIAGVGGLAASVAHLGQPRRAWRIFLGLRRSWLSREAVIFAAWFPLATLHAAARLGWWSGPTSAGRIAACAAGALGLVGLFCSAKIYADTRRDFWRMSQAAPRFFGSAAVLSLATVLACCGVGESPALRSRVAVALAAAVIIKLLFEAQALEPLKSDRDLATPALKTARLLTGPLRGANELRAACAVFGGIALPTLVATAVGPAWLGWPALVIVGGGEFLERSLFFRAVIAPKMPGQPA